jgi:Domain of unknown function (DUF4437)
VRCWALAAMLCAASAGAADVALPPDAIQAQPDALRWGPASPAMPAGTQIAVLEGDPKAPGMFTIRLKVPAGSRIAPHWHPRDERVTVLAGAVAVGFGDAVDERSMTPFGAGAFYVNPARRHHYVHVAQDSILQVTGTGPWEVKFLAGPKPASPGR